MDYDCADHPTNITDKEYLLSTLANKRGNLEFLSRREAIKDIPPCNQSATQACTLNNKNKGRTPGRVAPDISPEECIRYEPSELWMKIKYDERYIILPSGAVSNVMIPYTRLILNLVFLYFALKRC